MWRWNREPPGDLEGASVGCALRDLTQGQGELTEASAQGSSNDVPYSKIGSDVWIGGGALILPGERIGSRTVIGAGSVVTRDVPEQVFAAGSPCRVIRSLQDEDGVPT